MRETGTLQPWIFCPEPRPAARLRLFCIPYAGRGASIYREWPDLLGYSVELCALQLPGRENRLRERPFNRMAEAVRAAAEVLESYLDLPYALFGHSLGAVVCFELARLLRNQHGSTPVHLFVSARRAPQLPDRRSLLTSMSDESFVAEICHRYNGISVEILKDRELMELLLPTLRVDVEMLDTYDYQCRNSARRDCSVCRRFENYDVESLTPPSGRPQVDLRTQLGQYPQGQAVRFRLANQSHISAPTRSPNLSRAPRAAWPFWSSIPRRGSCRSARGS